MVATKTGHQTLITLLVALPLQAQRPISRSAPLAQVLARQPRLSKAGSGPRLCTLPNGVVVGALVAVNALGSATVGDGPHFWAAPFEENGEFGNLGPSPTYPTGRPQTKGHAQNTTIGIVATNATLTQAQCTRLATAAHDGYARALVPSHTPMDGDLIFAASHGDIECDDLIYLGHAAATCMARAIARGIL